MIADPGVGLGGLYDLCQNVSSVKVVCCLTSTDDFFYVSLKKNLKKSYISERLYSDLTVLSKD